MIAGGLSGLFDSLGWREEVRTGLEQMLATVRPGTAVFDFDQTILHGDISEALLAELAARRGEPLVAVYEEACSRDLRTAYVELVHTLVAGRTEPESRRLAQATFATGVRSGALRIRPAMRELVWALQRLGWEVWVVTASPEVLVQAVAEHIGVPPNRVVGMRSEVGEDGRYLARVLDPVTFGEGKLQAVRAHVGADPTFAAGDSVSDEPMMAAARHALLVDRGHDPLRDRARRRGWWIQPATGW
ncbi:MAG: HAD-IB family phosphatase [Alphaproteobacteria bacterium]|nr:HAD-IB family phosphatase [Alphaproteobacteria bacterium]MCB9696207.1 HAD-IB family phosphatase [Alphaproteobacteria bacterium]